MKFDPLSSLTGPPNGVAYVRPESLSDDLGAALQRIPKSNASAMESFLFMTKYGQPIPLALFTAGETGPQVNSNGLVQEVPEYPQRAWRRASVAHRQSQEPKMPKKRPKSYAELKTARLAANRTDVQTAFGQQQSAANYVPIAPDQALHNLMEALGEAIPMAQQPPQQRISYAPVDIVPHVGPSLPTQAPSWDAVPLPIQPSQTISVPSPQPYAQTAAVLKQSSEAVGFSNIQRDGVQPLKTSAPANINLSNDELQSIRYDQIDPETKRSLSVSVARAEARFKREATVNPPAVVTETRDMSSTTESAPTTISSNVAFIVEAALDQKDRELRSDFTREIHALKIDHEKQIERQQRAFEDFTDH